MGRREEADGNGLVLVSSGGIMKMGRDVGNFYARLKQKDNGNALCVLTVYCYYAYLVKNAIST